MYIGRVRGSVVLGKTLPAIIGKKIRVLEEIDVRDLDKEGKLMLSFDCCSSGEGEYVIYEGGPESAYALYPDKTGSDTNILAIIDDIDM